MKYEKLIRSLFITAFALILLLLLCACTSGESKKEEDGRIKITATIFPQYDFARRIAGDKAELIMLLSPGEETHTFDPSPADIINIQSSDIFIYGGGESDTWVKDVLSSMNTADIAVIEMMELCSVIEEETAEGMQAENEENDEAEYDEHVWTSPVNAMKIVSGICAVLCMKDPANADYYRANTEEYINELKSLDEKFREVAASAKRKTLIFGDRFPLLYFVREYGLDYYAAFPGCASNAEPSAETTAFLIDKVRTEAVPVVFKIELSNGQTAEAIARDAGTGAEVRTFYSCHTISADDFKAGETYLSLMTRNIETLREALN